jgi:hypothetical protein
VHKHRYPRSLNLKAVLPQLQTLSTSSAVSAVTYKARIQRGDKSSLAQILVGMDERLKPHEMPRRPEMPIRETCITTMWRVVLSKAVFELTTTIGDPRSQSSEAGEA